MKYLPISIPFICSLVCAQNPTPTFLTASKIQHTASISSWVGTGIMAYGLIGSSMADEESEYFKIALNGYYVQQAGILANVLSTSTMYFSNDNPKSTYTIKGLAHYLNSMMTGAIGYYLINSKKDISNSSFATGVMGLELIALHIVLSNMAWYQFSKKADEYRNSPAVQLSLGPIMNGHKIYPSLIVSRSF